MEGASTEATDMVSSKLSRHVGVIRDSLGVKNVVHLVSVSWSILWIHEKLFGAPGNRTPLFQLIIFIYKQTLLKILYEDYYKVSTKF